MGKRTVALDVKPRGEIRWNLDGTNVKEGKVYTGPIDIPGDERGRRSTPTPRTPASPSKNFTIRPVTGGKATIDPDQAGDRRQEDQARHDGGHVRRRSAPARRPRRLSATASSSPSARATRTRPPVSGPGRLSSPRPSKRSSARRAPPSATRPPRSRSASASSSSPAGPISTEFLQETSDADQGRPRGGPAVTQKTTIGFGVPNEMDPHHFTVEIPAARTSPSSSPSTSGCRAGPTDCRIPSCVAGCRVPAWSAIAEEAKRVLNERLKEKKLATSRWQAGTNKVERLLGRELCVLAWGVEDGAEGPGPERGPQLGRACGPTSAGGCSPWRPR